ncbi:MAG TPA: DUF3309 family protein [Reyranella sp.]|nr:DUF3309 family protein [Reyranella sp.]
MLVLFVAILLALISVATFPCWSYSARWGHVPSTIAGGLLLCVAMVVVGSKYAPKVAEPEIAMAATSPVYDPYNAYRRTVDRVTLARDSTSP